MLSLIFIELYHYEEAQSDTHFCVAEATHHNIHFCWATSHDLFHFNQSICVFIQYTCIETYINNFIKTIMRCDPLKMYVISTLCSVHNAKISRYIGLLQNVITR